MQPGHGGAPGRPGIPAGPVAEVVVSVTRAVEDELADLERKVPGISRSILAATARQMAAELDGDNSATSKSMCARVLVEVREQLLALVPEEAEEDALDDLAKKRAARRSGAAS